MRHRVTWCSNISPLENLSMDNLNFEKHMDKLIKSQDGYVWIDVTDKAQSVFDTGLFNLQAVWSKENEEDVLMRTPVDTQTELNLFLQQGKHICIYGGRVSDSISLGFVTQDSWTAADKITHEGNVYVRFKDLVFCK